MGTAVNTKIRDGQLTQNGGGAVNTRARARGARGVDGRRSMTFDFPLNSIQTTNITNV